MADVYPPQVRGVSSIITSAAAVAVSFPAGTIPGDLLILPVESQGGQAVTLSGASGWSQIPSASPQTNGNTRLTIFYKIADTTGADGTTIDDSGDHQTARLLAIRAGTFDLNDPFNTIAANTQASTVNVSITGPTTDRNFCGVLFVSAGDLPDASSTTEFSDPTNAGVSGLANQWDNAAAAGDGGSLWGVWGVQDTAGAVTATTGTAVNAAVRSNIAVAINPCPGPVVRGIGSLQANANAITPGMPAGTAAGDLLIMFVETLAQAITVSGWTELTDSPQTGNGTGRLTTFWKIAASGADASTTSDSGDHQHGRIVGIVAGTFDATTPFSDTNGAARTTTTSLSAPGLTTTRDNTLVINAFSGDDPDAATTTEMSAWANADLAGLTEIIDGGSIISGGSWIGATQGMDLVAGSVGATTATAVTSASGGQMSIAINPVSTLTHYSLDCQPGSYALTGAAATIGRGLFIDAQPGSYALTGADATLLAARLISADPGSYALTGAAATLARGLFINAEPGAYSLTGADATLVSTSLNHYALDAQPGAFAVTGAAATFLYNRVMGADPGSYAITGAAATMLRSYVMNCEPGVYVITGADATLIGPVRFIPVAEAGDIIVVVAEAAIGVLTAAGEILVLPTEGDIEAVRGEEG